ncbi:hypothetical protein F5X68DRAFT_263279 [Plectosphaerella plurivora]|uniref:F-box domain-containing protein n=1 Tax=Plectosphaerella plurivora TaxID=936078 RepID=A0A9P9A8V4_9PEZI|nr:hypothetical protein F5X68DRAFT_263279 [Plectosphaerella plurivora]
MTGWNNLPNELRDMIADEVRGDIGKPQSSASNPYKSLPLVSRDWQYYFSHINFHTLFLDQDRLDGFKRYLDNNKSRQHHVKHIFLRVKLPDYDCSTCYQDEGEDESSQHKHLFFNTLQRLFTIISKGGWLDGTSQPWITLDIGIYSPSDGNHAFRDYRFSPDYHTDAEGEAYKRHRDQVASANDDPCPGWQRAIAKKKPLMGAKRRLLSIISCPGNFFSYWNTIKLALPQSKLKSFIFVSRLWRSLDRNFLAQLVCAAGKVAFLNVPELENLEIGAVKKQTVYFYASHTRKIGSHSLPGPAMRIIRTRSRPHSTT